MKQKVIATIKYVLLFAIGLSLLWLTFRNENLAEIFNKLAAADPFWLGISLLIGMAAFISRAVRWIMLMEPMGYKPPLSSTLYALWLGYFANLAIPRIGEITRCGALAGKEKVPFNALIGTVIVERVIDLVMLVFTMTLAAALEFDLLSNFLNEKLISPLKSKFAFTTNPLFPVIVIAVILIGIWIVYSFFKKGAKERPLVTKLKGFLHEVGTGFKTILRMKNTGWFVFHTLFIWVLYFLMTYVCFFCLDATSHLNAKAGLFTLVVGGLGMAAPVQGGIGAYHYIVSQGLQLFGISTTDGIVYATLVHTSQTILVVVLGLFAMLMLFTGKSKATANG